MRKLFVFIMNFSVFMLLCTAVFASNTDVENFQTRQADRMENPGAMDFFFFPSRVEFSDLTSDWSSSTPGEPSTVISVHPIIVSDSFETTKVDALFADISADGGETWSYTKFSPSEDDINIWEASISVPEWGVETPETEIPEPGSATGTTATETFKTGLPSRIESKEKDNKLIICFWAMDSLGNITAEMYRQTKPTSEPEVRFRPLILDPADPERNGPVKTYEKSPDRDILDTSGAWVRDSLFFRMHIAGNLLQGMSVPPGYNYFIARFIPLDTPSFLTQLGRGMYQYYSIFPSSGELLSRREGEGVPFTIDYDSRNLYQLIAMISEAKKTNQYPIVKDYEKMLLEEGLKVSIKGEVPLSMKKTVSNTGLVVRHAENKIYWKVDADTFKQEGEFPRGLTLRFYTGYLRSLESSGIVMDDRTGYTTLYFENHVMEIDKDDANLWKYIIENKEPQENIFPEDEMDLKMMDKLNERGIRLPEPADNK